MPIKGLNRIEIINITTNTIERVYHNYTARTTKFVGDSDKEDKLIVTDRNCGGQGAWSIIDHN